MAKKQASGGARLLAAGKSVMTLGWTAEDRALIEEAAQAEGRPMTQYVQWHALQAAKKTLKKSSKTT